MQVYLAIQGQKAGPFSLFQVEEKLRAKEVDNATLGWYEGQDKWQPLRELPPFVGYFDKDKSREESRALEDEETLDNFRRTEAEELLRPRPWRRFCARMLDNTFFFFATLALAMLLKQMAGLSLSYYDFAQNVAFASIPAMMILEAILIATWGTTPGKKLLGIRLINANGDPPSMGQSARRAVSVFVLGQGFLMPVLYPIAAVVSYYILKKRGVTYWDASNELRMVHEPLSLRHFLVPMLLVFTIAQLLNEPLAQFNDQLNSELRKSPIFKQLESIMSRGGPSV